MTMGYMIMEIDGFIALMGGLINIQRIAKLLKRISRLNGSVEEMRLISKQLQKATIVLFSLHCILFSSFTFVAITRLDDFDSVNWNNILGKLKINLDFKADI